jgi:hypothetical protein
MQLVYAACKTRSYKGIVKLFPHEVADLEPALQCLLCQEPSDHATWEVRYVLLLWLAMLVLVPFDLRTVDSGAVGSGAEEGSGGSGSSTGLIGSILAACKGFLCDPGAIRSAAAVCLSKLLSRPDMDRAQLRVYFEWATNALAFCSGEAPAPARRQAAGGESAASGSGEDAGEDEGRAAAGSGFEQSLSGAQRALLATGVLQSLVEIAKHGHRDALREGLAETFSRVVAIAAGERMGGDGGAAEDGLDDEEDDAEAGAGTGADSVGEASTAASTAGNAASAGLRASPLLRKLIVKLAARTGLTYLAPRLVAWRYDRGQRSLLDNLKNAGVAAAAAAAATGSTAATGGAQDASTAADDEDEDIDVPPEMEDIVDKLLQGLRDTDTVVRWSAAKGIGRTTGRLPKAFADDVVAAVLQLLTPQEGDGAWHGGCLALAELARRGLLLPSRLPEAIPMVMKALCYDVRKGAHSVGQHVRDSACYVCWAFARAYAPSVMRPYVASLAQGMLTCALFDREVNCRRAASAAFQENVGRQGHENFPDGIAILTAADYFTLGNRVNAYLNVAPIVAAFPQYRYALLDHLLHTKLRHWDRDVREVAAKALARLAPVDPAWAISTALPALLPLTASPDLFTRHGATLGVAELALALAQVPVSLPSELLDQIRNVVVVAEKARAYTGRGGEMVRAAMCRLIECQCLAGHDLSRRAAMRLLQTVDDCLKHPNDIIQASALAALRALTLHAMNQPERCKYFHSFFFHHPFLLLYVC